MSAGTAIQLHGASTIAKLLEDKPSDASLAAVSKYKAVLLFYKFEGGFFYVDYSNGYGWEKQVKKTEAQLIQNLAACSFILIDLPTLEAALQGCVIERERRLILNIKSKVDAQFARVDARRNAEDNDSYWQGHYDTYEIVQNMIQKII